MNTWLRGTLFSVGLMALLALAGASPLAAQAGEPIGVDTTSLTTAGLAAIWNQNIPGGMAGVQTGVNMTANAGTLPPPVDPYQRDANGNLLLDAQGNPIRKPADQIAKEEAARQALIDAAKAAAALAAAAQGPQPGGSAYTGGITAGQSVLDANRVPLVGPNWGTSQTEHPFSTLVGEHADLAAQLGRPSGPNLWRTTHAAGLTVGNGTVSVSSQGTAQEGMAAVGRLLGGGPAVPVIGDPSNPTIINMPPVCKCCGAPISPRQVVNDYKISYGKGYGMMIVHEDITNCRDTPCNYTVCDSSYRVDYQWFGPGTDAGMGFAFGFNVMDSGCSIGGLVEYYTQGTWSPVCPNFRFVTDAVEIAAANLPALLDGYNYYSCAGQIKEPVYGVVDVCDNGHRQDWPCGPANQGFK